jgi:predicted phage terminase large subunit-like protein
LSRTARVSPLRQPEYEIQLPALHPKQREVADSTARFKVVAAGRQVGKTSLGAAMCVAEAAKGGDVWWVAPSYPIGELGWKVIDGLCRQIPQTRFEGRPVFRITLPTGGTIQLRSADNPDSLRGATLNGVVFDEAAQAKELAWPTLRPTLAVRRGWAMFISTPKGLNWFHDLYQDAAGRRGWQRWQFKSIDSPYFDPAEYELNRQEMSSLLFSQEYDAEFISAGSGAFQAAWIQHYYQRFEGEDKHYMLGEESIPAARCRIFHTVDLAWSPAEGADYTVISTWAVTPKNHLLLLNVVRGHFEGPDIVPKLRQAYQRFGGYLVVEKATRQAPILQEAVRVGLPIREGRMGRMGRDKGSDAKYARAMPATARMEMGTVWFPPASAPYYRDIEEELLAFPAGRHDDFVDTLAYAVAEIAGGSVYDRRGLERV